jgi:site-specific DNA recombinase
MIMKKAAIMCRVSSDEQAKGYSLDDQLERLQRYCEKESIEIVYTFKEDHSAKSFDRPAWKQWMEYAKRNHKELDLILFTTWDRFARDIAGAYSVMDELTKKYKIQPQAIEQKIDFSVPETKAMLALYLAMPEIDNDRRSIKIKGGIRQAYKQGMYIRVAPYGYKNTRDEQNKPIIVPHEINAPLIRYAFEAYANGVTQSEIRHVLLSKGLRISKSNFCEILRRVVYIGKIVVPANDEEPMQIVEGVHSGLVSEELFFKVQYMLNDKAKIKKGARFKLQRPELPMRGHLICTKCEELLTGSGSRGKLGKRYFYYHCNHCAKERYRADLIHSVFDDVLKSFTSTMDAKKLYKLMVNQLLVSNGKNQKANNRNAKVKMNKLKERLENLQDLLVDGTVSASDYKKMRARYESELYELKQQNRSIKVNQANYENFIKSGLSFLENLVNTYHTASVSLKNKILGSIFNNKLSFDGKNCRTPELNQAVLLIFNIGGGSRGSKKEQARQKTCLFGGVEPEGFEPSSKRRINKLSTCLFLDSFSIAATSKNTQNSNLSSNVFILATKWDKAYSKILNSRFPRLMDRG